MGQGEHLSLLQRAKDLNEFSSIRVCRPASKVSNLLTTEDCASIIYSIYMNSIYGKPFCSCVNIDNALYQEKNIDNSSIFFISPNSPLFCQSSNIHSILFYKMYLGLHSIVRRSKNYVFQSLKKRVWKIIQGRKEKLLSKGRKWVPVKSIPMYGLFENSPLILQRTWKYDE